MHVDNGRCFACGGTGSVESKPSKRQMTPAKVRARFLAVMTHPNESQDFGTAYQYDSPFVGDMRTWCRNFYRPHAEGAVITVTDAGEVVATGTVGESGKIEWLT